ncbi:MAG: carbon-nitrogen hydrolase family protein [Desulfurococcales archaeon]|nr:carbon-nitrogen hydrolase family protein [Desulfurococcales archaeon]
MRDSLVSIAVLHSRIRLGAKRANFRSLKRAIVEISEYQKSRKIDIVVLPPYPFTGPIIGYYPSHRTNSHIRSNAERLGGSISPHSVLGSLLWLAANLGIEIVVGPIVERAGPRLYITAFYVDRLGNITGKYRKIAVTLEEKRNGINPGKDVGVFTSSSTGAKIGVFVDEDLAYPEIFRLIQHKGVNIIIGFMLPYVSEKFKLIQDSNNMLTMENDIIRSFLTVRSRETGVPIVLVGGVVESISNNMMAYMDTIPVEPDIGVVDEMVKTVKDVGSLLLIDVDVDHSRPTPIDPKIASMYRKIAYTR